MTAGPACAITHPRRPTPASARSKLPLLMWRLFVVVLAESDLKIFILEPEYEFSAVGAIWPVEKLAEAGAVQVVLHVARIEMIEDVVNPQPDFEPSFLSTERNGQLLE